MSTNWINTNNSTDAVGILRKTIVPQQQQNTENRTTDLLVFGYACKIFRDDEKAINIDQGKHLIPWMGDESLKIDRYDVRATLSDLTQYEPPPGGYINRLDYLSPAEQRAEQLCEEERYYSLYHNEEEEQMYQEEELKRLHQQASSTYGQVQFDYNKEEQIVKDPLTEDENKSEEQDELYSPPAHLEIPESIEKPETMKLHAIIEKTAKFISSQGPQMEILIKAKQSNNPQFEFLNVDNRLNPYYKFILAAFKNGTYPTQTEREYTQDSANDKLDHSRIEGQQNDYMNSNYSYSSMIVVPTIKYKPSANCAYTQLISKIKGVPIPPEQPDKEESPVAITPTLLPHNPPSYQDNISSIENTKTESSNSQYKNVNDTKIPKTDKDVEIKKISIGLALAQCYNSDSEEENDENSETDQSQQQQQQQQEIDPNIPIPPDYLQHIIDKTAAYVVKNGKQFEDILREKQDSRFLFLDPNNEYHQYYMFKVTGVVNPYPTSDCSIDTMDSDKPKVITPVSFSIKSKEDVPVSIKPALPQETSDDESESTTETATIVTNQNQSNQNATSINPVTKVVVPEHVQRAIQLVENQLMNRGAQYAAVAAAAAAAMAAANNPNIVDNKESGQKSRFDVDSMGNLILNRSPLPSVPVKIIDSIQQKELKRAEEKVKDRLAQIAREKLGLISKEKQLQLERKKKAMAFLNQIKNSTSGTSTSPSTISNKDCKATDENDSHTNHECNGSDSGESSVHSIPILSSPNNLIENENSDNNDHDDDNYKYEIDKIQDEYEKNLNSMLITEKNKNKEPSSKLDNSKKIKSHSRSRSRSKRRSKSRSRSKSKSKRSSSLHKHKKKSSSDKQHSKKKSKRRSRSRSRSASSTSKSNQKSMSTAIIAINSSRNSRNSSSSSSCCKRSSSDYKKYDHDRNRDRGSYDRYRFKSPTPITVDRDDRKRSKKHSSPSPSRKSKKKKN